MELDCSAPTVVRQHQMAGMNLAELHHLVEGRLGVRLPRPWLVKAEQVSAGNPFYALELARHFRDHRTWESSDQQTVPPSLHALIRARLDQLDVEVRDLLPVVALAASPSVELLGAAVETEETVVRDLLEQAERADVVGVGDKVAFTHPLLAAVVVDATGPAERLRVHAALAHHSPSEEERVRHAALAHEAPDGVVAEQLEVAARAARRRGAGVAATELGRLALDRTPGNARVDRERRTLLVAEVAFQRGDTLGASELLATLDDALEAEVRSAALLLLARIAWVTGPAADVVRYGEQAAAARREDPVGLAETKVVLAHLSRHDRGWGHRNALDAVDIIERVGDVGTAITARALVALMDVETDLGLPLRPGMIDQALAAATEVDEGRVQDSTRYYLGTVLLQRDELPLARAVLLDCVSTAEARADDGSLAALWDQLAILEVLAGDWSAARGYAELQVFCGEANEQPLQSLWGRQTIALLDVRQGVAEGAARAASLVEQARALGDRMTLAYALVTEAEGSRLGGDPAGAAASLREADEIARTIDVTSPNAFRHGADLVEALVQVGDLAEGDAAAERLKSVAARGGHRWAMAAAARASAATAAARGDLEAALAEARASVAQARSLDMPFELGRTLLTLGTVLRRRRAKSAAAAALVEARSVFEGLGAAPWAAIAHDQHQGLGLRQGAGSALTLTEHRVARLAAQGLSNPEIAARLAMSRKTVEFNLGKAYRKLQIRNRAQLATALMAASATSSGEMPGSSATAGS
jgi:DNA-binding CsgD family transcriptional regulator